MLLGACGEESSSDANEAGGNYEVRVAAADFPTEQQLGQTSLLRLGLRNDGEKTVPNLAVTISIAGKAGDTSMLPFGIRDETAELAQPDRPVWVLAATYPRRQGSSQPGGTETSNDKTFAFGPLKPGETTNAVWKLSAVRAGDYTLRYTVAANLSGSGKARTAGDNPTGGSFKTEISTVTPEVEVTDSGEVVEKSTPQEPSGSGE